MVLRQMAEDMTYYGDTPNSSNIRFHNEFSSTSCPARSLELHGGSNESLRQYVIDRIKYYQSLGSTVQEMIDAENGGATKQQTGWISKIEDGKKVLYTPEPSHGILPGTTQGAVFEAARQAGWELGFGPLYPQDLFESDGVWLASSVRLIAPVTHLNGTALAQTRS